MTDTLESFKEFPPKKKKITHNQTAQTISANMIFPLLLVIPGVREFVTHYPEAYVSVQGLLNILVNFIREKVTK